MQQTSLKAYWEIKPKLNQKQQAVFEALEEICPATNKQIARHLKWDINRVTPRMLELRNKGRVLKAYTDIDEGRSATFWKPKGVGNDASDTE